MRLKVGMKVITNGVRFRVGMSLALGLIRTSVALGGGPLFPGAQYDVGEVPESVAIGDLDGDLVPDMAVANFSNNNKVSVLLEVGDGTFAAAVHYAAGSIPLSVAIGDLDGDLVPDLAVANAGGNTVSVWGVLILALLLLAGNKVVFRDRLRRNPIP